MKKLTKYSLDFDKTISFVKSRLEDANELSSMLEKNINFSEGNFYTLLPPNSNLECIYKFEEGGILNQDYQTKYNEISSHAIIPNMKMEFAFFIENYLKKIKLTPV